MINEYKKPNLTFAKALIVISILVASSYLLVLRQMWMFDMVYQWWAYQAAHLVVFVFTLVYLLRFPETSLTVIVVSSLVIGLMPYELWSNVFTEPDLGFLAAFLKGWPTWISAFVALLFHPFIQFLLFMICRKVLASKLNRGD